MTALATSATMTADGAVSGPVPAPVAMATGPAVKVIVASVAGQRAVLFLNGLVSGGGQAAALVRDARAP